MTYLKENWRQVFISSSSLALAVCIFSLKQPVFYNIFSFLALVLAVFFTLLKPRYAQYCYYLLAFMWFVVLAGYYSLFAIHTIQVNSYAARMLPTVISIVLPIALVQIFTVLFLGIAARVWFDQPIQSKRAKTFLNFTVALAIACFGLVCYMAFASLRPSIHWIVELHYSWSKSLPLILLDFSFWFFLFAALPLSLACGFVKSWSKWQTATASIFTSALVLFSSDRTLSFLNLESKYGNVSLGKFFIVLVMLFSTYYLSKYIQNKFINTEYLIGFD